MPQDLEWLLTTPTLPEPEATPFAQPTVRPGVSQADLALGCGIIAPFIRDEKLDFRNGCGAALIRASIERIVGVVCMTDTSHGDMPWRPEFGSLVTRLRHQHADDGTEELARYYVIDAIRIWEPRVSVKDAEVTYTGQIETVVGSSTTPSSLPPESAALGTAMEIRILYDIVGRRRGSGVLVPNVNQLVTVPKAA